MNDSFVKLAQLSVHVAALDMHPGVPRSDLDGTPI
jgi:hypothetical protein